jgi:glutathione-independent formaldehyde dehydrogenase
MSMILAGTAEIAKAVNATVVSPDDASKGYENFDKGAARKFVFDPHGLVDDR